jgi:hypothetical protein
MNKEQDLLKRISDLKKEVDTGRFKLQEFKAEFVTLAEHQTTLNDLQLSEYSNQLKVKQLEEQKTEMNLITDSLRSLAKQTEFYIEK